MKNLKNTIIGDITVLTLNKFLCKLMLQSARDDRDTAEMLISRMYDWPNIPIDGPQLIKRSVELDSNPDKELACKNTIKRQMEFVSPSLLIK